MEEIALPMTSACALDESDLRQQLARYRRIGRGATAVEQTPRRLTIELDGRVGRQLVGELLAIERECCPFFDLVWEPGLRRLTIAVSEAAHEPALHGISLALDLEEVAQR
jgi:hypothetical protein